jgi:hypothetical protein
MEMVIDRRSDIYFSIFLKGHEFLAAKYNNNISGGFKFQVQHWVYLDEV